MLQKVCRFCRRRAKSHALLHKKSNTDIYNSGKERVKSYFDIIPFIRQFREMQIFISTVLTHRQRLLLLFQRKMLISEIVEEDRTNLID